MTSLLGIDIGGSGSRVGLRLVGVPSGERLEFSGERIGVTDAGSTVPGAVRSLVARAAQEWPEAVAELGGVGVGATGLATLVAEPERFAAALSAQLRELTGRPVAVAVAVDAVTAHLGALGGEAGAIVALGTGAIAFGTDGRDVWRRVDGWGHLLGDRGAGAWIGLQGLIAAMRAYDGVDAAGSELLRAARERLGDPVTWPSQLYTRPDRAGVLASFAADVLALAAAGDASAAAIAAEAGREAARSGVAALDRSLPAVIATTGGVFRAGGVLAQAFEQTVAELRPDARVQPAVGDPLDGALLLAQRARARAIVTHAPHVWVGGGTD
ncbi:BadF/BadG/BcrA/BcrD ATPase family protein [Microbacterium sp. zg.Y909]|uniref:BadF/BadG/BcrA/BcrD ATPase family protein n=1 Tax=Microbacterium sp. zg.Y909 TaxID=2969413 RepID=UPI00214CF2B8|nr:BadF/BadG/BcrA/BcrD ATPase family protein [Microbacterium sp. zg.Y909]MCR2826645.1 hypothetical protein [Microbacterium sp. zg.Y909]